MIGNGTYIYLGWTGLLGKFVLFRFCKDVETFRPALGAGDGDFLVRVCQQKMNVLI